MKKFFAIILAIVLLCSVSPVTSVFADDESALASYEQDFSNIDSVRSDFVAHSVYDLGTDSEYDSIEADINGSGYWYLANDGTPYIQRKNLEDGSPLASSNNTAQATPFEYQNQIAMKYQT